MKYIFISCAFSSILLAQSSLEKNIDPCEDPLIKLARLEGIKAVPLKDMRKFKRLMKACEREGGKEQVKQLYSKDWQRDFKSSRRMASWTSTHAICVFVSFAYFFAGLALVKK